MNSMGIFKPRFLAFRTVSRVEVTVTPFRRAIYAVNKRNTPSKRAMSNSYGIGFLNCGPISYGVCEGQAEFDEILKRLDLAIALVRTGQGGDLPDPPACSPSMISIVSSVLG